jgi:hypothetical protein
MKLVMLVKKSLILAIVLISSKILMAQAGFDDDVADVAVPVDGGISVILGAAISYGVLKLRKNKDNN